MEASTSVNGNEVGLHPNYCVTAEYVSYALCGPCCGGTCYCRSLAAGTPC